MGARNTSAAYVMWSHMSDGAFRLLVGMGHRALDEDGVKDGVFQPARRFFGGADDLVTYVRSTTAQGMPRSVAARRSAAFRYLAELRAAGAVKIVRPAANGRPAEYALNLDVLGSEEWDELVDRAVDRGRGERPTVRRGRTLQRPNGSDAPSEEPREEPKRSQERGRTRSPQPPTAREADGARTPDPSPHSEPPTPALSQQYTTAVAALQRTVGVAGAGYLVAEHLEQHPDDGYRAAVLAVAQRHDLTNGALA